jgi:endoglucanase
VSTVQEEIGLRGATTSTFGINPEVGIAIDVTHASDNPGNENSKAVPCKLGAGPAITSGPNSNPVVERMIKASAKKAKIPFQISPSPRPFGNDANAMQLSRGGVATLSLGIPNRYMHTQVEICSYKDLENSIKLLAHFISSITSRTDFRPS